IREKIHFLEISFGSMTEAVCELQMACDLNYIKSEQLDGLRPQFTDIAKMLSGLRNKYQSQLNASAPLTINH
ncbi:MAG: four helix bundle protein, partial [Bacteroidales bacterium]|nr:four helix bundle protein [Bacteroidales bacterium]